MTEAELLAELGEWTNIPALRDGLNRRGADPQWLGGGFPDAEQAILAAHLPQAILMLWMPGRKGGHFVVSEAMEDGRVLIRDPDPGMSYIVDDDWISKYVAGGVFR